ncbi:MAG: hypothetical protein LUG45_02490 [Clostridiales bacterium]|nr:hypothetical protein [Clostridiales bacterium]
MAENEATKIEWIEKEPIPHFRYGGREYFMLNDSIEVVIDGVLYRVKSIYKDSAAFMGDVLDALTMEKINRSAA